MPKKKLVAWQKKYVDGIKDLDNEDLLNCLVEAAQDAEYFKPARFHLGVAFDAVLERMENEPTF